VFIYTYFLNSHLFLSYSEFGLWWLSVYVSGSESSRYETRFHCRSAYVGLLHVKSYVEDKSSSCWCSAEAWEGVVSSGVVLII
ncbi:hypothetical protein AVEN_46925-1, partial [Araneus ventricosus]